MYRTGDLARFDARRAVHHGRVDAGEARGHRVELGEIEARVCAAGRASVAAATSRRRGDALVVHFVPVAGEAGDADTLETLRAELRAVLPAAWMPDALVPTPRLPLLASGKVDRAALARTKVARTRARREGDALELPATDAERHVLDVVRDVLGAPELGVTDDLLAACHVAPRRPDRPAARPTTTARLGVAHLFEAARPAPPPRAEAGSGLPALPEPTAAGPRPPSPPTAAQTAMLLAAAQSADDRAFHMTGALRLARPLAPERPRTRSVSSRSVTPCSARGSPCGTARSSSRSTGRRA